MDNNIGSKEELTFIREEMKNNLTIRTTLLTFCFTAVITTIGFGLTNFDTIPFIIYLVPIIITVAFSCRITYYKDLQCRMNAYLNVFHKDSLKHEIIFENYHIYKFCTKNKICSFVINNELLILSIVCVIIYYVKFTESMKYKDNSIQFLFWIILPIILCIIQYFILHKVPSYNTKSKQYIEILNSSSE